METGRIIVQIDRQSDRKADRQRKNITTQGPRFARNRPRAQGNLRLVFRYDHLPK